MAFIEPKSLGAFFEAIKNFSAPLLSGLTIAISILMYAPVFSADLPQSFRPWLMICMVAFGVVAIVKWAEIWWTSMTATKARKVFHLTPIIGQCLWCVTKQSDESLVTQILARFSLKNMGTAPLGLTSARLIKPKIKGHVLSDRITVRAQHGTMHGTAYTSDFRVAAGTALPASVVILIRGRPQWNEENDLPVTLAITDEDGNEERVRAICKGIQKPKSVAESVPVRESLQSLSDPIEKDIAAVLQSEVNRYDNNGRRAGGFGSIHLFYRKRVMNQFSTDSWTSNSPINQEIMIDPGAAELRSDNLNSLLALYARITDISDHDNYVNALLSRLDESKGYTCVSYFIVCALWKLGFLNEALEAALFGLPENDMKDFGVSNILMLFNAMMRYRHPDFTNDALDSIERFLLGTTEHQFRIPQKIAAIRTRRLMQPEQTSQ